MILLADFWSTYFTHPLHANGYQWWSGAGSDLGELTLVISMITLLVMVWHHLNCHEPSCKRIGRHRVTVDGHQWLVCGPHHAEIFPEAADGIRPHVDAARSRARSHV